MLDRRVVKRFATKDKSGQALAESPIASNHDGSLLLTMSGGDDTVHLWDTVSETRIAGCPISLRNDPKFAFSPRPGWFAVTEHEKVTLYQYRGTSARRTMAVSAGVIGDLQFSPYSRRIATLVATRDNEGWRTRVERWELGTLGSRRLLTMQCENVATCRKLTGAFLAYGTNDEKRLVASSNFHGVIVLQGRQAPFSGVLPARLVQQSDFVGGQFEVVADPYASDGLVASLAPGSEISPDWDSFKHGSTDWHVFAVLKTNSPHSRTFYRDNRGAHHIDLIDDGNYHLRWIGALHHRRKLQVAGPPDARVHLDSILLMPFDLYATGELRMDTPLLHGPFFFSPNGKRLWGVVSEKTLVGANVPGFEVAVKLSNLTEPEWASPIYALAAGSDVVVLGLRSGEVLAIEATSGKEVSRCRVTEAPIRSVAIDDRESIVVVGAADGYLAVHRLPDGRLIQRLKGSSQAVSSVALSRDGQQAFSASGRHVHVWRREDDRFSRHLGIQSSSGRIDRIRLSHDNRYLAVHVQYENAVRLWDLRRLSEEFAENLPLH